MADSENTTLIEETEEEVWREIPGYEGYYSVSSLGRVRRDKAASGTRVGSILKSTPDKYGYLKLGLSKDGVPKNYTVHVLVALAFIGTRPPGLHEVNHIDTVKFNNTPSNLEYCTHQGNIDHAIEHRRHISTRTEDANYTNGPKGETHGNAKLTSLMVIEARRLYNQEGVTYAELARRYGVRQTAITRAITGVTWKHLDHEGYCNNLDIPGIVGKA